MIPSSSSTLDRRPALARALDAIVVRRTKPAVIVSDNGTEMTSRAVPEWTNRTGIVLALYRPPASRCAAVG